MSQWIAVADRLRTVKQAQEEFLVRDYVDRCIIGPLLLDRLAVDLADLAVRESNSRSRFSKYIQGYGSADEQ